MNTITAPAIESITATKPEAFGITVATMKRLLSQPKPSDAIALYLFLAHTANRQGTLTVYATDIFIANGLGWSLKKVSRVKMRLRQLALISPVKRRGKSGQFSKHFIRVSHCDIHHVFTAAMDLGDSPVSQNTMSGEMTDEMLDYKTVNAGKQKRLRHRKPSQAPVAASLNLKSFQPHPKSVDELFRFGGRNECDAQTCARFIRWNNSRGWNIGSWKHALIAFRDTCAVTGAGELPAGWIPEIVLPVEGTKNL